MMNIRKILMPTDFSECSNYALDHALFLAEQFDAELHFLHVATLHHDGPQDPIQDFPSTDTLFEHLRTISAADMKSALETHRDRPLRIHEHIRRGIAAAPEIIASAEEEGIDLIVMGAHGRRGLRRLILGSVAEEVVRTAACPVLTLRSRDEPEVLHRPEKILVPVDFSEPSKEALRTAVSLARIYDGRLEIVHVVEQPVYPQVYEGFYSWLPTGSFSEMRAELAANLEELVADIAGDAEIPFTIAVLEGEPAREICEYVALSRVDLTVLSTHGLTGLEHLLLGSVAERVVRGAPGPVLTVKAPRREDAGEVIDASSQAA